MNRHARALAYALAAALVAAACGGGVTTPGGPATQGPRIGAADRPVVLAFAPSAESGKILESGDKIAAALSAATGLTFKAQVPTSYAAVIEGMCSGKVEVAFLPPLSYVLGKDKGCAEVLLVSVRNGLPTYRGQIRVRSDSGIGSLAELRGRKFAFVDPVSTSGSMYPQLLIKKQFNQTAEQFFGAGNAVFAGGHDKAMIALYNKQVDGAASFIDVSTDIPSSALKIFPDLGQKTKRIAETEDIPSDTFSVRPDLPTDLKARLKMALADYAKTEDGKKALLGLYSVEDLTTIPDSAFDGVREAAKIVGINLEEEAKKTPRPAATATPAATKSP